jgi:hypothetical protein
VRTNQARACEGSISTTIALERALCRRLDEEHDEVDEVWSTGSSRLAARGGENGASRRVVSSARSREGARTAALVGA